ncbi:hypothetical protein K435DRAFT_229271 [Dendrothele bispora CBS 962.96]|uniref:Epidermal growth factor receptor-like transmembrane-juxtamembrane segment domain-containing protein n=1 Tax=Dendrothele bispora (strain CBS 962.96) TaxID=1314807 RepID=A0A4S8MM38_DENBC|nr:hypothetical protein K435DRAFT_229271 [Dendrothele bispora CBS 962.96]
MSTSCSTSATATQTQVLTTDSLSTSFSLSVESGSSTVSTVTFTTCLAEVSSGVTESRCSTSSSLTTIPGGTTTTSVPVVITVPITSTSLTTLLGSSCTVITTQPPSTTTTITSQTSTTLPNGSVSVGTVTVTSLIPQTDATSEPTQQSNDHSQSSNDTNIGGIIGGVVGGVLGLVALILVIWLWMKRRSRWDDIFDKEDDKVVAVTGSKYQGGGIDEPTLPDVGAPENLEPQPYEYGFIGNTPGPNPHSYNGYGAVPPVRPQSAGYPSGIVPGMGVPHPGHNSMLLSPQQQQQLVQQFGVDPNNNGGRPTSMHSGGSSHGGRSSRPSYTGYPPSSPGSQGSRSPPTMSPAMSPGVWISNTVGQLDGQFNVGVGGFAPVQSSQASEYFASQGQRLSQVPPPLQRPHTSPAGSVHESHTGSGSVQTQPQQEPGRRLQVMNGSAEDSPLSPTDGSRPVSYRSQSTPISEKQRLSAAMGMDGASQGNSVMAHRDGGRINDGGATAGPSGHPQQQSESEAGPPPPAYEE